MNVVIIGASYAGVTAALEVRKQYQEAEIILVDKQTRLGYIPNGLHLYLDREIQSLDEAYFVTPDELDEQSIDYSLESTVTNVDIAQKLVHYEKDNQTLTLPYDKLIIATGSSQISQKIVGSDSERVLKYKWRHEAEEALTKIENSQHITIIGGGQIGVEVADLLRKHGKRVALIENMDYLLFKYFDKEMVQPLQEAMEVAGIDLRMNQTVSSIEESDQGITIQVDRQAIESDLAILAANVRPDLRFLANQLNQHVDQTLVVDGYLQTSEKDVFAIGDCIQIPLGATGETFYAPLVNNAVRTGVAVANNLTQPTRPFAGALRTIGTFAFGYYIASTGLTESDSVFSNQKIMSERLEVPVNSLPNALLMTIKYTYDSDSRVLLGAQLISKANILDKINTLSLAIQTQQTLEDLHQKEFFFHPVFTNRIEATNLVPEPKLGSDLDED